MMLFDKLRAVVASDVFRGSMLIDQLRKDLLHFTGVNLPIHMDTQALPGILIDDIEHSQFAPSLRRVMNKIPRPDMPTMLTLGRKTRRFALSPALGLFRRHRQSKLSPQPLNVTSPHLPALLLQQSCDLRISQLRMLIGFPAQSSLQLCLPGTRFFRPIRVGATIQPKMPADPLVPYIDPRRQASLPSVACVRGLQLFFKYLLQQFFTQHLVGQHSLEPGVLPLELLELLGLIDLEHPQLSLPPVVGLLTDLPLSAYVLYRFISALRFPEDANLSFCCVSFYFHFLDPF